MLGGLVVILLCQLAGEFVVRLTHLPVPGPVVGMVLFFGVLLLRKPPETHGMVRAGDLLLRHLTLFFVPASVGIVAYLPLLLEQWVPVTVGLVASWLIALVVTGATATVLLRLGRRMKKVS